MRPFDMSKSCPDVAPSKLTSLEESLTLMTVSPVSCLPLPRTAATANRIKLTPIGPSIAVSPTTTVAPLEMLVAKLFASVAPSPSPLAKPRPTQILFMASCMPRPSLVSLDPTAVAASAASPVLPAPSPTSFTAMARPRTFLTPLPAVMQSKAATNGQLETATTDPRSVRPTLLAAYVAALDAFSIFTAPCLTVRLLLRLNQPSWQTALLAAACRQTAPAITRLAPCATSTSYGRLRLPQLSSLGPHRPNPCRRQSAPAGTLFRLRQEMLVRRIEGLYNTAERRFGTLMPYLNAATFRPSGQTASAGPLIPDRPSSPSKLASFGTKVELAYEHRRTFAAIAAVPTATQDTTVYPSNKATRPVVPELPLASVILILGVLPLA